VQGHFEVKDRLHVEPAQRIFILATKVVRQAQGRIGRDAAPLKHDVVDARGRYVQGLGQCVGAQAQRFQIVFAQDFAGMDCPHAVGKHHDEPRVVCGGGKGGWMLLQ